MGTLEPSAVIFSNQANLPESLHLKSTLKFEALPDAVTSDTGVNTTDVPSLLQDPTSTQADQKTGQSIHAKELQPDSLMHIEDSSTFPMGDYKHTSQVEYLSESTRIESSTRRSESGVLLAKPHPGQFFAEQESPTALKVEDQQKQLNGILNQLQGLERTTSDIMERLAEFKNNSTVDRFGDTDTRLQSLAEQVSKMIQSKFNI